MSTANNSESVEAPPAPTEPKAPSPVKTTVTPAQRPPPPRGARTEPPVEPANKYLISQAPADSAVPIGNKEFVFAAKLEGKFGIFYERSHTNPEPTAVEMDLYTMYECSVHTLTDIIDRALRAREYESFEVSHVDANQLAHSIADGITVLTYCKLRSVNYLQPHTMDRFYYKPMVPEPFEVPEPYALAIEQLGSIKVSGKRDEQYLMPTIQVAHIPRCGLPGNRRWTPSAYCQAVEMAKKIGLHFSSVDLSVKMGSSWWLYRAVQDGNHFELQCMIPEENYTEQTAALRNLYSVDGHGGYQTNIVDLTPLGNTCYGSMFRNPQDRVDLAVYYAVTKEADIMWRLA